MASPRRRLLLLAVLAPAILTVIAGAYMILMASLEGESRGFWASLQWASETLTTTGYGGDAHWQHPAMVLFVVLVQLLGLSVVFLVVPILVIPYFEERFQGRLPRGAPDLEDYVLLYRWGPAVATLVEELERAEVPFVIYEEEEPVARMLFERGHTIVHGRLRDDDPDPKLWTRARAIIANGSDEENGGMILAVRQLEYDGEILALAEHPLHRRPMTLAGADAVYTPKHVQAAALADLAVERVAGRVAGMGMLKGRLQVAELRVVGGSDLAGKTLRQADLRRRTGATVIGRWRGGDFVEQPGADEVIEARSILVAVGSEESLTRAAELATPLPPQGPVLVVGYGEVGRKVAEFLRDAECEVRTLDRQALDGVDFVGDALDPALLRKAGAAEARTVVLCVDNDTTTLFLTTVVRDLAPDVPIVARVERTRNVQRMHAAGADFGSSLAEVAGEILAHKLLGDAWLSLGQRVKLVRVSAAGMKGKSLAEARIGARTGCAVVAIQRGEDVLLDIPDDLQLADADELCLCAREDAIEKFFAEFPDSRQA